MMIKETLIGTKTFNSRGEKVWTPDNPADCRYCADIREMPHWARNLLYTVRYTTFAAAIVGIPILVAMCDNYNYVSEKPNAEQKEITAIMETTVGPDKVLTLDEKVQYKGWRKL